jgi:hypothetical protein
MALLEMKGFDCVAVVAEWTTPGFDCVGDLREAESRATEDHPTDPTQRSDGVAERVGFEPTIPLRV